MQSKCLEVEIQYVPPGHHDQWWGLIILPSLLESGTEAGGWEWRLKGLSTSSAAQFSCYIVSDSVRPYTRQPTRLPHPWDSPGKNTGYLGWEDPLE